MAKLAQKEVFGEIELPTISTVRPAGRVVTVEYNSEMLNRLDRLTSANYGMSINKFIKHKNYASGYFNILTREWSAAEKFPVSETLAIATG